jgi:hypothetical protein
MLLKGKTQADLDRQAELAKVQELKAYLASTDWYYARQMETGEAVPEEIKTKRLEARETIRRIEG